MAYSPLPTYSTGDLFTAANANTYWRDNFAAGVPDLFTTKGDLAAATGVDAAARLAAGTARTILVPDTGSSTGLTWFGIHAVMCPARAYRSTSQSIPNAADTLVQFDVETFDTQSCFTTGASAKYTAPVTGWYLVSASVGLLSPGWNGAEQMVLKVFKDGAFEATVGLFDAPTAYTPAVTLLSGSVIVYLISSSYVDIRVWQNSGAACNTTTTTACHVSVCRVG